MSPGMLKFVTLGGATQVESEITDTLVEISPVGDRFVVLERDDLEQRLEKYQESLQAAWSNRVEAAIRSIAKHKRTKKGKKGRRRDSVKALEQLEATVARRSGGISSLPMSKWDPKITKTGGIHEPVLRIALAIGKAETTAELARLVDELVTLRAGMNSDARRRELGVPKASNMSPRVAGDMRRSVEPLIVLRAVGLLGFPPDFIWSIGAGLSGQALSFSRSVEEEAEALLGEELWGVFSRFYAGNNKFAIKLVTLFLTCVGAREIGDVSTSAVREIVKFEYTGQSQYIKKTVRRALNQLRARQKAFYQGDKSRSVRVPQSYLELVTDRVESKRSDSEFSWFSETDKGGSHDAWREAASDWTAGRHLVDLRSGVTPLNDFLDYVVATDGIPPTPLEYCKVGSHPTSSYVEYLAAQQISPSTYNTKLSHARRLLDYVLELHREERGGKKDPDHQNPLAKTGLRSSKSRGQTQRNPIPQRIVELMKDIIVEDDYAWPKSIQGDWMTWIDPATGIGKKVWSPVRAEFMLLRLLLPIREIQGRLLDSGEGDQKVFVDGEWRDNPNALDDPKRPPQGFIRQIWDATEGRFYNGLFVTTNKTQDKETGFLENGYEIPWQNDDIISLFERVRDWQKKFNRMPRPMKRSEINRREFDVSDSVAERLHENFWLFRDAAFRKAPHEPVPSSRMMGFFRLLTAEVEQRLWDNGERNADGSKIELVTWGNMKSGYPHPTGTIFDQHAIRVTGLTGLAKAGVPLGVLSEMVAGHASVLMTLYYIKPGAAHVTKVLEEAAARLQLDHEDQWIAFLESRAGEAVAEFAIGGEDNGQSGQNWHTSGLWTPLDFATCPNGGTLCHVGGPLIAKIGSKAPVYGPTPGKSRNCLRCRFVVTGPAFLPGLVAQANSIVSELRESLLRLQHSEQARRDAFSPSDSEEVRSRKLRIADNRVRDAEAELDDAWERWAACLNFIQESKALLESESGKNALLLPGGMESLDVSLSEVSDFALWDRVCRDSEFFTSVNAKIPALRRGKLFDALLTREGDRAVFASMSDEELVMAGNHFSRYLRSVLGEHDADRLVTGKTTLGELGLDVDFGSVLHGGDIEAMELQNSVRLLPATS